MGCFAFAVSDPTPAQVENSKSSNCPKFKGLLPRNTFSVGSIFPVFIMWFETRNTTG